jgi:2-polyprenyl-3-methyl-5-hydroxy-6-metoxy-1,4-benzoquinol methylase
MANNIIREILIELGVSSIGSFSEFFPRTRDREDVAVLKCSKSGVIILSKTDHIEKEYYKSKEELLDWGDWITADEKTALLTTTEDTKRRYEMFSGTVINKKWLDIGCGLGPIIDKMADLCREVVYVETDPLKKAYLQEKFDYRGYSSVEEVPDNDFEMVTLFHVFEHVTEPITMLKDIWRKMKTGAKLIVEVPHSRDFLISFANLESFKKFTFLSEHLILHTRESLRSFFSEAGFENIEIVGAQRHPLANHLYWLIHGERGGGEIWSHLRSIELDNAYSNMLKSLDYTDTLIAVVRK